MNRSPSKVGTGLPRSPHGYMALSTSDVPPLLAGYPINDHDLGSPLLAIKDNYTHTTGSNPVVLQVTSSIIDISLINDNGQ